MKMKKKQITVIALAGVLVAIALLYFLVIAPLMDENDPDKPQLETAPGEGIYYGYLMMYPEIATNDVISITVNNSHGSFTFDNRINEDTGKRTLALADYPRLKLSTSALSSLRVYTLNTQCRTNEPMRDCSPETMASYGVTRDTCQASYTVRFYEGEQEKEYTVFIGDKTLSAKGSYFATVEGRDVIYEIDSGLEGGLFIAKEDFVDPLIGAIYSETEVVYEIQRIMIGKSNSSLPFVGVEASRKETDESINVSHSILFPTNASKVTANSNYVSSALNSLLVSFTGDKVVEIDPSEETCKKYGLGKDDTLIVANLRTFGLKEYQYTMSSLMTDEDGGKYYYLLTTPQTSRDVAVIVRIPAAGYEFLESENAIKWVATNSVEAGFVKYIYANEEAGESGVKDISIMSNTSALKNFNEKFILKYEPHPTDSKKGEVLTVTTESGRYTFTDNLEATLAEDKNQFNNFYAIMVNYPMPNRFNTLSEAERAAVKTQENLILSIRITMNDGATMGYDYYKIDSANVMCEFFDEKITTPTIVFDTTVEHINILATALNQLISGEKVEKH